MITMAPCFSPRWDAMAADRNIADTKPTEHGVHAASSASVPPGLGETLWEQAEKELAATWSIGADSLVIFDWDDTLLPTTVLLAGGHLAQLHQPYDSHALHELPPFWRNALETCAAAARQTLGIAKRRGRVLIVTNAAAGWVFQSMRRFMPDLASDLIDVPVISARSICEPQGITEPWRWKMLVFQRVASCFRFDPAGVLGPRNLMSIGDSCYERDAVMQAAGAIGVCHAKSVKLVATPSVAQLVHQLNTCSQMFDEMASHQGHLDFWIPPLSPQPILVYSPYSS